jgi:hypothetical protein
MLTVVSGSIADERVFSALEVLKGARRNRLNTHLECFVRLKAQSLFTLQTFPLDKALKCWNDRAPALRSAVQVPCYLDMFVGSDCGNSSFWSFGHWVLFNALQPNTFCPSRLGHETISAFSVSSSGSMIWTVDDYMTFHCKLSPCNAPRIAVHRTLT